MNRWLDKWFCSRASTSVCQEHSGNAKYRQPDVSASFAKSHYKPLCTDLYVKSLVWKKFIPCEAWMLVYRHDKWGKLWHQTKIIYPLVQHELVVNVRTARSNVPTPAASTPHPYSIQLRLSRACAFSALKDDFYEHPTPLWHPTPRHPTHIASSTPWPLNPTWVKLQGSPLWKYLLVEKGKISGTNREKYTQEWWHILFINIKS